MEYEFDCTIAGKSLISAIELLSGEKMQQNTPIKYELERGKGEWRWAVWIDGRIYLWKA